jgi:pimeloyl-ACP methyl ester carboxylesterase
MSERLINGIKLHYELHGGGNAVLFVHGFLGNGQAWRYQTEFLANKYKVITTDMRGHGKTDRPVQKEDYSMELLSYDLYYLLQALQIEKCCIVGHSWGARIAAQFAVQHREMLVGAVLISNSGDTPKDVLPAGSWEKMSTMMREQGSVEALLNVVETDPLTATFYNYQHEKQGKMLDKLSGKNAKAYASAWDAFTGAPTITSELEKLNLPVLLIGGEKDLPETIKIARRLHRALPGSYYRLVKGVGHFPQDDAPDIVNREILKFVDSLKW